MIPLFLNPYELKYYAEQVAELTGAVLNEAGQMYIAKYLQINPASQITGETAANVIASAILFSALGEELKDEGE